MRTFELQALRPLWLPEGKDWAGGVEFDCPVHGGPHRLHVRFIVGLGGYELGKEAWRRRASGGSFLTLSLDKPVPFPGCFVGTIQDGKVIIRRH